MESHLNNVKFIYKKGLAMKNVLIITASNAKNLELAQRIKNEFKSDVKSEVVDLVSFDFPLYSPSTAEKMLSDKQMNLILSVVNSEYFIFVAPEYNGGVPPVLSNFIAWTTISAGADWRKAFNGKLAALASFSGNNGNQLMSSLMVMLNHLGVDVMGRKLLETYSSELNNDSITDFCQKYLNRIGQMVGQ
jgi:NAD(P)H-dependent FMN reductase